MAETYPQLPSGKVVALPKGHTVIDICLFRDRLIVATDKGVYLLAEPGEHLIPIQFVEGGPHG